LNFSQGADYESEFKTAEEYLKKAEEVVLQRGKNLFYPRAELLIENVSNLTIYRFGYLKQAHELCFWKRELYSAKNIIENKKHYRKIENMKIDLPMYRSEKLRKKTEKVGSQNKRVVNNKMKKA